MAIISAIWKKAQRFLPLIFKTASPQWVLDLGKMVDLPPGYHPTNPSLLSIGDGEFLICVRGVNYTLDDTRSMKPTITGESSYRTINKFFVMSRDFATVRALAQLDDAFSDIEDVKLFAFNGETYGIGSRIVDPTDNSCCIVLVKIDRDLMNTVAQDIPSPFGLRQEKNWCPFNHDGNLCFLYSYHPLIILRYKPETRSVEFWDPKHAAYPARSLPFLVCGSSPGVETPSGYLFVAHRRSIRLPWLNRAYISRIYHLDRHVQAVTGGSYFVIEQPAIQFVNGLHMDEQSIYVSYGSNDRSAHLACFDRSDFLKAVA
jgi:hypothetical protein